MSEEKKVFTEKDRPDAKGGYMDNPENLKTDKESIYDMHEDMQTVDAFPVDYIGIETGRENIRRNPERQATTGEDLTESLGAKRDHPDMEDR